MAWLDTIVRGSTSISTDLLVIVVQAEDGNGDYQGLSGHVSLVLDDADLDGLTDFNVLMALLGVVPVQSRDQKNEAIMMIRSRIKSRL